MLNLHSTIASQTGDIHILILGGGRGGEALLDLFFQRHNWLHIDGAVDLNIHASAMKKAANLGIPIFQKINDAIESFQGDIVIDVTGNSDIEINIVSSHHLEIISGKSARLLFDLVIQTRNNQQLLHHSNLHLDLLNTMLDLSLKLDDHENTQALVRHAVKGIHQSLSARKAFAILFTDDSSECFGISENPSPSTLSQEFTNYLKDFFTSKQSHQKQFITLDTPLLIPDIAEAFNIAIPIIYKHEILALLLLQHHEPLDNETEIMLRATSLHLHMAIQSKSHHQELAKQATLDPLTNIYNRRQFNIRLYEEFDRLHRKSDAALSCMFLDIDFFKTINDQYGHEIGDLLLVRIAKTIKQQLRAYDIIGRYGGDEFIALLPSENTVGKDIEQAVKRVAERILKAVSEIQIGGYDDIQVNLSIGIATIYPSSAYTSKELVSLADEALYHAKEDGRGCIKVQNTHNESNH